MATDLAFSDYLDIRNLTFEWAESYDNKDWESLHKCLAPSIRLDFRSLRGELHEKLSPEDYVVILSGVKILGNKLLKTQHLLGGAKWECLSDGGVKVEHQLRVAHQRYTNDEFSEVANKGHGHGAVALWYRKFEGMWKIEGVAPRLGWFEYDLFGTLDPNGDESS
ncbi:hypothetical protein QQS21_003938 [Conoideocrella luteorostrata]|uniref:Scytalone dehydratase-like domain-containing protein n=1 Tax=Conoideocrella luteorostrata TaxID=1105319 RepID=A0AAJ0CSD5_9HYPO|nr:hypothetical protein QQS21_003938 [Conoideocrella luteorostrata]